jgi:aminopeptidase N
MSGICRHAADSERPEPLVDGRITDVPGTNLTREEAAARAALLAVTSYHVALDLTAGAERFGSRSVIRFTCRRPGATSFVDLIATEVTEVVLNGRRLEVAAVVEEGRITLPALAADNELVVAAQCVYMNSGEGLHRFVDPVDGEVYLYTQFEVADARRAFACFDQPDLKASFAFSVTGSDHWQVLSASPTPEPVPSGLADGTATWHFTPTPRLSPYVTAVVAGPYHRYSAELTSQDGRRVPLGVLCRSSLADHLDAEEILEITRAGFAHFEALFDLPYPFTKYDQIFVPEFNAGAMENAGCVTFTEDYVFRSKVPQATVERRALTVLHELAHMWFGDLVTMRWWDDLWLNESFAEYASTRCQAEATRWRSAWTTFLSSEKAWAYRQDQLSSTHPIVAEIGDLADVRVNFDGITYAKGAAVLKQLVSWVGKDAFDEGVRRYFRRHAWSNTTLRDLLAELEATSGHDLSAWSAQWLEQAGVNTLRAELATDAGGVITSAVVLQETPPEHPQLRSHRLAIGGYDLTGQYLTSSWRAEVTVSGDRTEVPELVGRRRPELLLLNDADLAYTKIRLDAESMATAVNHLAAFSDALPATLIWGAAWDMTRDGELGARTFVDLVLRHLTSVTSPSVQQTLLHQLAAALAFYVCPPHAEAARDDAAQRVLKLLRAAVPGSDTQLLLARSFTGHAWRATHLDVVDRLLDGSTTLPGLVIDTDMRWTLLACLVAGGRAGREQIGDELARDDTASGRLRAASARAAIPTPRAKQEAWAAVVESDTLPNAVQSAVIRGFTRVHDAGLLEPFVEPYFAALDRVWKERTHEMATQIVEGLYPARLAGPRLLRRTDAWLEVGHAEPALERLVSEGRDGVLRALRAQARDAAVP